MYCTKAFKKLDLACGGYDSVSDWNSFASSTKSFSLLKCLKLKRAPSYFANGIDLCYRLSLLFELVTLSRALFGVVEFAAA